MAYTSRNNDSEKRYEFREDNSTISELVQPSNERQSPQNPYASRDQYTTDSRRTGDTVYDSTRRTGDNQSTVTDNRQETDRKSTNPDYARRGVPTADVFVDPYRRPTHGHARTCVMEVNISVTLGGDRAPQASIQTNNYSSKPPAIRSTAFIDDVRYVDLNFQAPGNTAQLSTDGLIRSSSSSPRESTGFQNKNSEQ